MRQPYELSIAEKAKLLWKEIYNEYTSSFDTSGPYTRMKDIIIPCFKYSVRLEMRMRAAQLPEAQYHYDDTFCVHSNTHHRIMLEFPHTTNHAKYITGTIFDKTLIAAFDLDRHSDIVHAAERVIGEKIRCTGGGELRRASPITVYGTCTEFGAANHDKTVNILKEAGLEAYLMAPSAQAETALR